MATTEMLLGTVEFWMRLDGETWEQAPLVARENVYYSDGAPEVDARAQELADQRGREICWTWWGSNYRHYIRPQ